MTTNPPQLYDFSKPSKLDGNSADQLSDWIDSYCSLMKELWTELAATEREFSRSGNESMTFQQVRQGFSPTSVVYEVLLGENQEVTLLMMERNIALAYALEMVGASCTELPEDRKLSPVEISLIELFFQRAASLFSSAWPKNVSLPSTVGSLIEVPHRSRVFDPSCTVMIHHIKGEAEFGEHELVWITPQEPLEELLDEPTHIEMSEASREKVESLTKTLPVDMTFILGEAQIPLADLPRLAAGDVIVLDRKIDEPIEINVEGEEKFSGWPGRNGSRRAVQIQDIFG